ncbi:hypothetical protein EYF80_057197 [Liparis tanakae]|uniref:Uncharacterized protein n=1 Tax=Liparis tanakae TaxID=230148 RepID=A0A4Z2EVG5_9TELE|nr:hypothetical protein EYF80_057197 [Liparis tanakae]
MEVTKHSFPPVCISLSVFWHFCATLPPLIYRPDDALPPPPPVCLPLNVPVSLSQEQAVLRPHHRVHLRAPPLPGPGHQGPDPPAAGHLSELDPQRGQRGPGHSQRRAAARGVQSSRNVSSLVGRLMSQGFLQ